MENRDKSTVLRVKDLSISIPLDEGMLTPVRGVEFSLREHETLALVGESGCGKSLTCKAILGINEKKCRAEGSIEFTGADGVTRELLALKPNGREIRDIRGKHIAMIFQEPMSAFSPLFTVGHQMTECLRIHAQMNREQAKDVALKMMRRVGIANVEKRFSQYPHEFSGGMLQRVLIAMALLLSPRLLIADEPTTALDVTIQAQILELLSQLQKDYGMSILYITHDLGTVAQTCDRVAVMYLGKIVETGPVDTVFENPAHPYTRGLLGSVHRIGGGKERLFSIEGAVPLAMNLDDRCGFYERCTHRHEAGACACDGAEPALVRVGEDHYAACYAPYQQPQGGRL